MAYSSMTVESSVPWQFSEAGEVRQWTWHQPDFTALILCTATQWTWQVRASNETILGSGSGPDFPTCADLALEVVGKSMPSSAGYGRWTHASERRYTLSSGLRVDLSAGEGVWVRAVLVDGTSIEGNLALGDWMLHLEDDHVRRDVHPATVVRIEHAG